MIATALEWWTRLRLWRCAAVGAAPRLWGRVWIHGGGWVFVGDGVELDGRFAPIELHAEPGGAIVLGDGVRIESGASIEAQQRVILEAGCRVGRFAKILDNHFHPVRGRRAERPASVPVRLRAYSELGPRAIVLPGADIGEGARVGAGVVVSRRVRRGAVLGNSHPPPSFVAGEGHA